MNQQLKVSVVVLAGGLARRMNQQDKGLVDFKQQPMISYALQAAKPIADELWINANRNIEQYQAFNYPVISDATTDFAGPLAGVSATLEVCHYETLLVLPCDSPFMTTAGLQKMLTEFQRSQADIAVAYDGERLHPVFMVLKRSLQSSLQAYLASGKRRIDRWFEAHQWVKVDFSENPEFFANINTLEQLTELSAKESSCNQK